MDNLEKQISGAEYARDVTEMPAFPVTEEIPAADAAPQADPELIPALQTEQENPYVTVSGETDPVPAPAVSEEKPAKKGGIWKSVVAAILVLALVITACAVTAEMVNDYWEGRMVRLQQDMQDQIGALKTEMQNQMGNLQEDLGDRIDRVENDGTSVSGTATADGLTPGQVYAMNERSVVLVYSEMYQYGQVGYSTGSGFILSADGYIVTNAHVVEGGVKYLVITNDNVQHEATLVGTFADNDLAVLKVEAENLIPVKLGSSDLLVVGDQVAAIGNPLGELTSTLTVGFVSAKERYVTTEGSANINMMQTDCAINSGNSGGPLFNMKGEVVGITTAKYSGTSSGGASIEGIGFAIPIDDVKGLIADIIAYGHVRAAYMGVMVTTQEEPNGVYVQSVEAGWCAEKAGLQAGDIIISIGEYETPTMVRLTRAIRSYDPGDTVEIVVRRGNQKVTMTITFDERPGTGSTDTPAEQMPLPEEGDYDEWYEYFRWFFENQQRP